MSRLFKNLLRPILFRFRAETAHEIGLNGLRIGLSSNAVQNFAKRRFFCHEFGEVERFGLNFPNPLGMAAGFDKNGVAVNQLASLGFGFVEVGTVTFDPQYGNEKPRLFRLPKDDALINRLGFNNEGTASVVERLKELNPNCILGINIGKNKSVPNEEATRNYLMSFDLAYEVADYIAVNISSPNTPNLRELQRADALEKLLEVLQQRNRQFSENKSPREKPTPLLIKIAPDLDEAEIETIVHIAIKTEISGIIATNTTIGREKLETNRSQLEHIGDGGLSGKPIRGRSNEVISKIYKYSKGKMPIVGVGGIFTAEDAFEKIVSGACLVQAYTGFIYTGITFARDVNFGLARILKEKGFDSLDEAVGSMVK